MLSRTIRRKLLRKPSSMIPSSALLSKARALHSSSNLELHSTNPSNCTNTPTKPWKDEADTVIVGGGIVGTSIAYHLSKMSRQDVVLLEKSELTAGSTWHAAGLLTLFHPGINIKQLHWYSMNFYTQLEAETGQQVGLHQPGSMRLATTPERVDEMRYQMARQGWNTAPQCLMTPEQVKEMVPIINIDKVLQGLYTPADGYIDPYSLTMAIAAGARKYGANIYQNTEVSKMEMRSDGSWDVITPKGTIHANRVVNCTGFWGKEVGKMCGMDLPLVPMEHQYLVTKSIPEVQALKQEIPVLRDLEGSYYLRMERDGLLVGPYEKGCHAREDWVTKGVPPGFGKELYQPDLDRLAPHLEAAMDLVPCFQKAEIQAVVNGPITYSPDILPMLGPTLMPNMWLAVGFAYGIIHGGGVGKYLSEWILNGEPTYDLSELDPLRYGKWANSEYALAKCKESYGMNNAIGYPHEERLTGRPTYRVSGVHNDLLKAGAFMGFHAGWEQPDWYALPGETAEYKPSFYRTNYHEAMRREHELITTNVGILDITPFAKFIVKGKNARSYLDYVVAGTVPKAGRTSLAHALTPKGKVMAEFTITGLEDGSFMILTGSGSELHDLRHLQQIMFDEKWADVEIENVTDDFGVLSVVGPNSKDVLAKSLGNNIDDWKFLDAKKCNIAGVECLAIRISYTGELGWEIYTPLNEMKPVYDSLLHEGQEYEIGHFGTFAVNVLRMEKGFKAWGSEFNCDGSALEAGLEPFIRWNKKSNFIGKDNLLEEWGNWRNQKLVMMDVDLDESSADPEGNLSVWIAGRVVGNTTSGCFSPAIGKGLVFAYIPRILDTPGIEVHVEIMGKMCKARVLEKPPVLTQPIREKAAAKQKVAAKIVQ